MFQFAHFVIKDQSSIMEHVFHVKQAVVYAVIATSQYVLLVSTAITVIQLEAAQSVQQIVQFAHH